jgi:uncharacterized membrane protein
MNMKEIFVEPVIPLWVIYLLFCLGGTAAILLYRLTRKRLARPKAIVLTLLRLCALFLLISFLLNPFSLERKEYRALPSLAILFDTSPSMGLPGRAGKGRLDEARSFLFEGSNPLFNTLSERFDVSLYGLGESIRSLKEEELSRLTAGKKKGNLGEATKQLSGKASLVLLLSDGNLKWDGASPAGPPLLSLPTGDPEAYRDILIKEVKAPHLAFRGREVRIDAVIKTYGYRGMALPVVLKDGSRIIAAKDIRIHESPGEFPLTLSFTPEKIGQHNLDLSIPVQVGENIATNNRADLFVKVVRDKIRILMVSGNPSLNYRFMRMALKNDPSIDLLSFVILRTPSDILNVPIQEQSLIPFPVDTLFSKELNHFDLLIFDNLPSHLYINPAYYIRIREFIREGGGLAMVGGPHLLDGGRYLGTPLGEILPVKVTGKEAYRRDGSSVIRLSRTGRTHPVTQLSPDENENESLWRDMPPLDGMNFMEPKAYKNVLLEGEGGTRPLLVADSYGKGRTLVLGTDFSWKWYMGMISKGKSHWAYLRFIERMVRWLTKDPSLEPLQIALPETSGEAGQELEFRIRVKEERPGPGSQGKVLLSVFDPEGVKIESHLKAGLSPVEYLGIFTPRREGIYRIRVELPNNVQEEFLTIGRPVEEREGAPDHKRLKEISAATGGNLFLNTEDLLKGIENHGGRLKKTVAEEKRSPLWSLPYALFILLSLLCAEWYLRRRWGLI